MDRRSRSDRTRRSEGGRESRLRSAASATRGVRPGALSAVLQELVHGPERERGGGWGTALRPGAVIGRFELVREVGRGGFGVVYEARDRELGRLVAFKAVRAGPRAEVREQRLLLEAEAAARLSHPNIVTLHDVGRSPQGPYLVMELLRGRTLAQHLRRGPLPVREALRIGLDVAKGLAHAHAHGVIHRDLKPGNIFLCDDGQVKVLDLGMAHAFGHRKVDGGTPAYMAPEQWRGAPEDERTDVFALGVVLFEMVAGAPPFPGDRAASAPGGAAPELAVPEVPALGDLVARMLAADPVKRPRDAGDALAVLARFAAAAGAGEGPEAVSELRPGDGAREAAPAAHGSGADAPGTRPGGSLDPAVAARIERQAAAILGPIAHPIARRAAEHAATPSELADEIAAFMPKGAEREGFLRTWGARSGGGSGPRTPRAAVRWDAALLERATRDLAEHVGPLARILVARAAARAISTEDLYALLACEIPSAPEREAFLRTAPGHGDDAPSPA